MRLMLKWDDDLDHCYIPGSRKLFTFKVRWKLNGDGDAKGDFRDSIL